MRLHILTKEILFYNIHNKTHISLFKSAGRKNSIQKPFSMADKVKFHAVLSQFGKCCESSGKKRENLIKAKIFNSKV